MLTVKFSSELHAHLSSFLVDGASVGDVLFEGGRLAYPGRKDIEYQLGYTEPYTLELEARIVEGFSPAVNAAIRFLAAIATDVHSSEEETLRLLWESHREYSLEQSRAGREEGPALDRLVAALVTIEDARQAGSTDQIIIAAASALIKALHIAGIPPTPAGLEELFDGADPACVGLGLVEIA